MDGINERFAIIRKNSGLNAKQFAISMDMVPTTVSSIENGNREPSKEVLIKLAERYSINLNWMLTGDGPMFTDEKRPQEDEPIEVTGHVMPQTTPDVPPEELTTLHGFNEGFNQVYVGYPKDVQVYSFKKGTVHPVQTAPNDPSGMVMLPLFSQRASAGPGEVSTQLPETESIVPVLYDVIGYRDPKYCGVIRVCGDSMSDLTLFNGDWALFDRSDKQGDGVFVISLYGDFRIKRLQYRSSTKEIIIMSENRHRYPDPEIVPKKTLEEGNLVIYGRVFGWLHKHQH